MNKINLLLTLLVIMILACCSRPETRAVEKAGHSQTSKGLVEIMQSWQGDYPVSQLDQLPEAQRENAVGYINDSKIFHRVWKAFKPGEEVPAIDFKNHLVLFSRNTQFFNRISIFKVEVTEGVAQVLSMETRSARPIEDKVAMSLVLVAQEGISSVQSGEIAIPIVKKP